MNDTNDLISFIASMSGESNLRVEENLGEGFVRLRVAEAERRQAKHDIQHVEDIVIEMLRNARDAGAANIYLATSKEEGVRTLLFFDDGCGIPSDMHERIFDARVTSKLESMKMVKQRINKELETYGVLMTMFDSRTSLSNQVVDEVKSYFGDVVFNTLIPRTVKLSEAPSFGMSIIDYAPNNKGAKAYMDLAKEVIARA